MEVIGRDMISLFGIFYKNYVFLIFAVLIGTCAVGSLFGDVMSTSSNIFFHIDKQSDAVMHLNRTGLGLGMDPRASLSVQGNSIVSAEMSVGGASQGSNLTINGTFSMSVSNVTQSSNISQHSMYFVSSDDNIILWLPQADTCVGRSLFVKNIKSGIRTTLRVENWGVVENHTIYNLDSGNFLSSAQFFSDGSQWLVTSAMGNAFAHPNLYCIESFDNQTDVELNATISENGWATGWKASDNLLADFGSGNALFRAGSISSNVHGSLGLSASGNKFGYIGPGFNIYRGMSRAINWDSNSTVFVSILIYWQGNHSTAASRFRFFFMGDSWINFGLNGDGVTGDKMLLRSELSGGGRVSEATLYPAGTYLLVAKIVTRAIGSDNIYMSIFSENDSLSAIEPVVWDHGNFGTNTGSSNVFRFDTGLYHNKMSCIDEVRIGPTWSDVVSRQP